MIVLDTNVISEIFRPSSEPRVIGWLVSLTGDVAITSITLAELLASVRRLPDGRRKDELSHGIAEAVTLYRGASRCSHSMLTRRAIRGDARVA